MNHYELTHKGPDGVRVVATATAGTQQQAARKLYRAHNVPSPKAQAMGFAVQYAGPATTTKESHHAQT